MMAFAQTRTTRRQMDFRLCISGGGVERPLGGPHWITHHHKSRRSMRASAGVRSQPRWALHQRRSENFVYFQVEKKERKSWMRGSSVAIDRSWILMKREFLENRISWSRESVCGCAGDVLGCCRCCIHICIRWTKWNKIRTEDVRLDSGCCCSLLCQMTLMLMCLFKHSNVRNKKKRKERKSNIDLTYDKLSNYSELSQTLLSLTAVTNSFQSCKKAHDKAKEEEEKCCNDAFVRT